MELVDKIDMQIDQLVIRPCEKWAPNLHRVRDPR
jgi:hypothetical protein